MTSEHGELPSRKHKQPKKKSKKRSFLKGFLFILLLSALSYGSFLYIQADRMLDNISAGTEEEVPAEELAKEKSLSILILGLDARPQTGTMNTDVIMVASMNPERKSASFISIPRDTLIEVDGYRPRKANNYYPSMLSLERQRANSDEPLNAYQETKNIFGQYLNIPIDYVMIVDFKAFEEVINQLGGIDVDVDIDMRYVDPTDGTDINLQQGSQKLDGKQALDFVRYRMSNRGTAQSSDFQRNERQQKVVAAVIDEINVFTVFNLNGIFNAVGDNIKTDIPKKQLLSLIQTYAGISNDNIQYTAIEGVWKSPYTMLNEESFKQAVESLRSQLD